MNKLLLIEDDELMVRMYKRAFELDGYQVDVANDGLEGCQKAETAHPDLILLDIMMPKLNGLQALERLMENPKTQDCRVVMLTNLANKTDAERALKIGAIKYLIKSEYDPKQILEIVKELLPS